MILSIGMIVKNEEKYLRKCLEALKPVLDEINSELIIADTGSTDRTVEIAKDFTEKVYYFEWCDDYSKARNFTLHKSSGEWFMFVDADEILQNPQTIISFFKTGKYKKYDWASCIQRNLKSDNVDEGYGDYMIARIFKKTPNTVFTGAIHETVQLRSNNYFNTYAVFHHYGYISGRNYYKKTKRYAKSILKELENAPDNIRSYLQLIDAYSNFDLYNAIIYAYTAADKCGLGFYINLIYERLITCLCSAHDDTRLFEECGRYFALSDKPRVTDINITDILIKRYYNAGLYDKVIDTYKKYIGVRELILNKKLTSLESGSMSMSISDSFLLSDMTMLIISYIYSGNYAEAKNVLDDIYIRPKAAVYCLSNITYAVLKLYEYTREKKIIMDFLSFADNNGVLADIYKIFEIYIFNKLYFKEYMYDIIEYIDEYGGAGDIHKFYGLLFAEIKHNFKERIHKYISESERSVEQIPDLLYFILKYNYPISEGVRKYLKTKTEYITEYHFDDWTDVLLGSLENINDSELIIPICEQLFVFWERVPFRDREKIQQAYYNALSEYLPHIINDTITPDMSCLLEPVIRFRYLYKLIRDRISVGEKYDDIKYYIEQIELPINIFSTGEGRLPI